MKTTRIRQAATVVGSGGIIAYPTEAVFGLGCDPRDRRAVGRLLAIKHRPEHKGLILIVADIDQLRTFIRPLAPALAERVMATWPGPVTWLLPARPGVPRWLRGRHRSIAVRVTDHPVAAALCRQLGTALVSTSANRAGRPPCREAACVRRALGAELDFILPEKVGERSAPSRILDGTSGIVVRE